MIYIKKFETDVKYNEYINDDPIWPNVSICGDHPEIPHVHYTPILEPVNALKFTALENSTFTISNWGGNAPILEISLNGRTWSLWDYSEIELLQNKVLYIRGNNPSGFNKSTTKYSTFGGTGLRKCEGNIMHLLDYTRDLTTIPNDFCFWALFRFCKIVSAPELPATTLKSYCYGHLFNGCSYLTETPELPAQYLASSCYASMFANCPITNAPILSATSLADGCYYCMFTKCKQLTTTPVLPATTLKSECYYRMFSECTSLTTISSISAVNLAERCCQYMFADCTALTTVPTLPAMNLATDCYYSMFEDCTSLTTVTGLPALTLVNGCYRYMFRRCTSLNYIRALFTTEPEGRYTSDWVLNVSPTGTFVKKSGTSVVRGTNAVPENWTVYFE